MQYVTKFLLFLLSPGNLNFSFLWTTLYRQMAKQWLKKLNLELRIYSSHTWLNEIVWLKINNFMIIASKQIQTQESRRPSWSTRWFHNRLQQGMISYFLTLYNQTSVCIFSILFSIHFLRHRQGEFLQQSRGSLVVIISFILMTLMWDATLIL